MKRILGLDLGTNSIGWSLIKHNFENKEGEILGLGSRIIPMSQDILGKFDAGQSHSQTAERTSYRGVRRLLQRQILRRERLHRVLNILNFLPKHYKNTIDFEKHFGQFKNNIEVKFNYKKNNEGKHEFIFMDSFNEMVLEFKKEKPDLFYVKKNRKETKIPLDWTIYYLRKKALSQKINKEELAWILLNFNQKRGYYQLRGEDENDNEDKTFETLLITEVKKTEDVLKKTGEPLFDIYFKNGWKYDKQTTKPEIWLNKTKEFIVTTSTLKNGELKRSYKAVDSEKDWIAIKKKTEQDIAESKKTVGQYIYETLLDNPTQKIRGKLIKTIERKFYKKELERILDAQIKYHPELINLNLYKSCVKELYPRNEAHQNNIKSKDLKYLFVEDIIFYQRPLKSKKSTISNCPYEERFFYKDGIKQVKKIKCIAKSNPLFQEFRLWQFLQNLKIYQKENTQKGTIDVDVTKTFFTADEDWTNLFDELNNKKEVEQKHILQFLVDKSKIEKSEKGNYRWNYVEDKKYPANETRTSFLSRLKKVNNCNETVFLSKVKESELWHIIYSVKDKNEYKTALETFAMKNHLDEDTFLENFLKYPPFSNNYGAYSEKAIKRLLPLMRIGKYWDETKITDDVKELIYDIETRLKGINYDETVFGKDENDKLETIIDDDIPKQFLKSFLSLKNKNPLKGLNTYQACYAVYKRHSEAGIIKPWKTPKDIDCYLDEFKQHSLRNPIVEQIVTETLRVVRDIWQYYGKGDKDFFNEIHVELGREMKNSSDKRKAMSSRITENENTNSRIKELLKELKNESLDDIRPYSPSHQEILKIYEEGVLQNPEVNYSKVNEGDINKIRKSNSPTKAEINKYKLWLEQGYISPYTGEVIPLSKLFSIDYEIEHIIPQSRYFDNSMSNKIICESEVNRLKDNKTAIEFLNSEGGRLVEINNGKTVKLLEIENYKNHCSKYFKKNRTKLKNLLSEDIPEGFINRQLNDSRYISKIVKTLLSNIVRKEGEKEVTTKNLLPVTGSITSKLKQDWGLNDKWNEIIAPRFKRMNELTNSSDYGFWDDKINAFRITVPEEISRGFSKKRIDHRHHALDALIIACCTRKHTNYLSSLNSERENHALKDSLLIKNEKGDFTKYFQHPWLNFTTEAKDNLEKIIISFKQNLRIINKTNNKTWQWKLQKNGTYKKELEKQKDAKNSNNKTNWAIRKPIHKETISGFVKIKQIKKGESNLLNYLDKPNLIFDKAIKSEVQKLISFFDNDIKKIKKHLKENPLKINEKEITKIKVYEWTENATATRVQLTDKFSRKQLNSITDSGIRKILNQHIKSYNKIDNGKIKERFDLAFNADGVDELNKNIQKLNDGKFHHPIFKVRVYEEGSKFTVGETGTKDTKFVEAAQGTNLFFAIYHDKEKNKRVYETIPLYKVIEHQKQNSFLPKEEKTAIPIDNTKGKFLFSLSPNDLIYLPTEEEIINKSLIDLNNLSKEQISKIMVVNDFWDITCYFTPNHLASSIAPKEVDLNYNFKKKKLTGSYDTKTAKLNSKSIKEFCLKIELDRLGNITKVFN